MNEQERALYTDFHDAIKEGILKLKATPTEHLINWTMTRINQDIVELYKKFGINDTEFLIELQKVIQECLIMKGYAR